jgi:signal transduction histidine kinase
VSYIYQLSGLRGHDSLMVDTLLVGLLYMAFATVPFAIAVLSGRNRDKPGATPLVVVGLGAGGSAFVQGLRMIEEVVGVSHLLGRGLHAGLLICVNVAVLGTLYVAVEYTGRTRLTRRWIVGTLVALAFVLPIARISAGTADLAVTDPVANADFVYRLLLAVVALSLFARQFAGSRGVYRKQSAALLVGMAIGSGFGLAERFYSVQFVEFTIIGMTVGCGVIAVALFRYDFLETVPIARETLFEQVTDPVIALDGVGRIVDLNRAAYDAFALDETILGADATRLFSSDEDLAAQYDDVLGTKDIAAVVDGERRHFDPEHPLVSQFDQATDLGSASTEIGVFQDVGVRYYQITASRLEFAPNYEGQLVVFRDVTASKEREHDLNRLKQVLTRVLRHNLRNDANAINGFARSIAEHSDDGAGEKAQRIVGLTEKLTATSETARHIEDVIDADGHTEFDLPTAVESVVGELQRDHPDATIEWSVPALTVRANPELPAAIEEVIENAIVHGGDEPTVEVGAQRTDRWVDLTVSDDGPGIPDYELETIEQGEETALVHSSGAGLWLIQTVVEDSNGDVRYDSDGEGTTVRLRLPAAD